MLNSVVGPGHKRQQSQEQNLIAESDDDDVLQVVQVQSYGAASPSHPMPAISSSAAAGDRQTSRSPSLSSSIDHPPPITIAPLGPGGQHRGSAMTQSEIDNEIMMSKHGEYGGWNGRPWWRHPRIQENWRLILASLLLTVAGFGLLTAGITVTVIKQTELQGWVFLLAGALFFIPGFYHLVYICCILAGRPGYKFENLPAFS